MITGCYHLRLHCDSQVLRDRGNGPVADTCFAVLDIGGGCQTEGEAMKEARHLGWKIGKRIPGQPVTCPECLRFKRENRGRGVRQVP